MLELKLIHVSKKGPWYKATMANFNFLWKSVEYTKFRQAWAFKLDLSRTPGSGHGTAAVLLPGFAINRMA